jgi:calcium binding protein
MGWAEFANGDLLLEAEKQFEALVTTDQNLRYQQNLASRRLAILILPFASWPKLEGYKSKIVAAIEALQPGDYIELMLPVIIDKQKPVERPNAEYLSTISSMPKSKIDESREERITNEIFVDCYNESERFKGWYCHLEEKLSFPFRALCIATRPTSPLERGEEVEVIALLDDETDEPSEIFVRIRWRRQYPRSVARTSRGSRG